MRSGSLVRNIFVLTGAGLSAESGLGTFRDTGGMWAKFDPMTLATPQAFLADPAAVHAFYDQRRRNLVAAVPNAAHAALARLEAEWPAHRGSVFLCTQNIDDLLERAGARHVHHMHGELLKARCLACEAVSDWRGDMGVHARCPRCGQPGLRPHVVWFGEMPMGVEAIEAALGGADLFVAIGTSGAVYPAAGFVAGARANGARTLELNLERADNAHQFDDALYGPATETVPAWVDRLLADVPAPARGV